MQIDEKTVRKVAQLAQLELTSTEEKAMQEDLNAILDWVEQLKKIDVADTQPMISPVEGVLELREDQITGGKRRDDILANAPKAEDGFFIVPKVVE